MRRVYSFKAFPAEMPSFITSALPEYALMRQLLHEFKYTACVILLDTSYYRANPSIYRNSSIMSEKQWRWLEEVLTHNVTDTVNVYPKNCMVTFIGSGIQVLSNEKPIENWFNFLDERTRLLALIRKTKAERIVFLSGDIHAAEIQMDTSGGFI